MENKNLIRGSGGGGKGGGGTGGIAQEEPNNLECVATARIIDLIGEGQIGGLVAGLQSIFLDGTPLKSASGKFNFKGVKYYERIGTVDQDPIPFDEVEGEVAVGVVITKAIPVTRTVEAAECDSLRILLSLPCLLKQSKKDGDISGSFVNLDIWVEPAGGSFIKATHVEIAGKTNQPYMRSILIQGFTRRFGPGPWNVKIERITPDPVGSEIRNEVSWASYSLVLNERFTMPNTAAVGLEIDAKQFGSKIPTRGYEVYGCNRIRIPTNYNPGSRKYTGLWDGTWKLGWTDNPAWIFLDLCLNERYGLGHRIKEANVDKWAIYEIARYCDQKVPDGYGHYEPRWTCTCCIQNQEEAYHMLHAFASAFLGMPFWGSGLVTLAQDRPTDPTHIANPANVIDGLFNYSGTGLSTRCSVVYVTWNDPDDGYKPSIEVVEDPELIEQFGWKKRDVMAVGCVRRSQARRLGKWILDSEKYQPEVLSFVGGFDFIDCAPGNIIEVADPHYSGLNVHGRFKADCTAHTLNLDRTITLNAGEDYTLSTIMPDGTLEERPVSSAAGEHFTLFVNPDFSAAPAAETVWIISSASCEPRLFRCLANKEVKPGQYEIHSVYHDPGKYDRVYNNLTIDPPVTSLLPSGEMPVVAGIQTDIFSYIAGKNWLDGILLSWEHPKVPGTNVYDPRVVYYDIRWKKDAGWHNAGETQETSFEIRSLREGEYTFGVRCRGLGTGDWIDLTVAVADPNAAPPDITNPKIITVGRSHYVGTVANVTWDDIRDTDYYPKERHRDYRVQVCTPDGLTVKRTVYVVDEQFLYTTSMLLDDFDAPYPRTVRLKITTRDVLGKLSTPVVFDITKQIPTLGAFTPTLTTDINGIYVNWEACTLFNSQITGFYIYCDTNANPVTKVAIVSAGTRHRVLPARPTADTNYKVKIVPFDTFGSGTASLVANITVAADNTLVYVQALNDDNTITPTEKKILKPVWDAILLEGAASTGTVRVQATKFKITGWTSYTNFAAKYDALYAYVITTLHLFDNMSVSTTGVTRAGIWDVRWKDYFDARTQILNDIALRAKGLTKISQGEFGETFEDEEIDPTWVVIQGDANDFTYPLSGMSGGPVFNNGGEYAWLAYPDNIPFDPSKLYKMRVRVRKTAGAGNKTFYCGVEGVAADGVTLVNASGANLHTSQHFVCAAAANVPVSNEWSYFVGYFKGTAATGDATPSTNPSAPKRMHTNVRYIRPVFIVSFNSDGDTYEIDSISIEIMADEIDYDLVTNSLLAKTITLDTNGKFISSAAGAYIEISKSQVAGYAADRTTKQFYLNAADGKAYAGGGAVVLDSDGLTVKVETSYVPQNVIAFKALNLTHLVGKMYATYQSANGIGVNIEAAGGASSLGPTALSILAQSQNEDKGRVLINAEQSGTFSTIELYVESFFPVGRKIKLNTGYFEVTASFMTLDGQFQSTLATGTAPFTIASTTLVTNLNADLLDGLHSSAFALTAKGVTNGDSHNHAGGDGAQIAYSGLSGIPTTFAPASHGNADHSTPFVILGGIAGGQVLNGGTVAGNNLTLSSTAHATKGKILFGTSGYDEVNNRLGIGTASPNHPLEIYDGTNDGTGGISISSFYPVIHFKDVSTDQGAFRLGQNQNAFKVDFDSARDGTYESTLMTFNGDGRIGMGTTSLSSLGVLTLGKDQAGTDAGQLVLTNTQGAYMVLGIALSDANAYSFIKTNANEDLYLQVGISCLAAVPRMMISGAAGNVGFNSVSFGTNAAKVLSVGNGTAPNTGIADGFQMWSQDIVAGNAALHCMTELGHILKLYRQNHIIDPTAEVNSLRTAVMAILVALENTGFLAAA
ncbi:MAG: phage tail protein [Syntrophobacteraceae bacterium]